MNTQYPTVNLFGVVPVDLGTLILTIAVIIVIFLIAREIACWYWKINERVDLLKDLKHEIKTTNLLLRAMLQEEQDIKTPPPSDQNSPKD